METLLLSRLPEAYTIFSPIVGIVFPALSMALFFLYISMDDID